MWEPIASGELAARAWRAIEVIADSLAPLSAPAADLAVFWTYLATAREDERIEARMVTAHARFAEALQRGFERPALCEGLAGAGWAAAHVVDGLDELLAVIDDKLLALLEPGAWRGEYDLISGPVGFGVYFLERASEVGCARVVDYLARTAIALPDGLAWLTPNAHLDRTTSADWPDGVFDGGVAHGTAGAIGVLARIAARPDAPPAAAPLAADATRWLLAQRRDGVFPAMTRDARWLPARTGWCYGSPGIALALHRPELADWPSRATGVDGASLCHGAATLLHASNRMYQATREPRFRADALTWLDRLLALPPGPASAPLVDGSVGVALALLASVTDLEPAWDRQLLFDAPVAE